MELLNPHRSRFSKVEMKQLQEVVLFNTNPITNPNTDPITDPITDPNTDPNTDLTSNTQFTGFHTL